MSPRDVFCYELRDRVGGVEGDPVTVLARPQSRQGAKLSKVSTTGADEEHATVKAGKCIHGLLPSLPRHAAVIP